MFHLGSDIPFNGTLDEWPRRHGHAGREQVMRARTVTWASFAYDAQRERRRIRFERYGTVRGAIPPSATVEDPAAAGCVLRAPRRQRVDAVEACSPGSRQIYEHMIWHVLDPRSDLRSCFERHEDLTEQWTDEDRRAPLRRMFRPGASPSLDAIGTLCARIRLAKHAGDAESAFLIGCDVARALCLLSLASRFTSSIEDLSMVVVRTLLAGLAHKSKRLASEVDAYLAIYGILSRMRSRVDLDTGIPSLVYQTGHTWPIYVSLFGRLIDAVCTADAAKQDAVQDALDTALGRGGLTSALRGRVTLFESH